MSSVLRGSGFRSAVARPMVGDTKTSMVRVDHLGWMACDGRSLLKAEYRALYAVLQDSFGSVDVDHFNLPDAEGRVVGLIGQAITDSSSNVWVDGDLSGEETHTLVIAELPAHNHDICGGSLNVANGVDPSANGFTSRDLTGLTMDGSGSHFHTGTTDLSGLHNHTYLGVGSQGAASGLDNVAENTPRPTENTGSAGNHSHTFTTNTVGDHRHNLNDPTHRHAIASNGGSQPHNNLQPTIFMGNLFVYSGRVVHNVTDADGFSVPATNPSYYPPSTPAHRLY